MKYKLIKEYPGSFPKETVVEYDSDYGCFVVEGGTELLSQDIVNWPEHWEEIEDLYYLGELLKVKGISNGFGFNRFLFVVRISDTEVVAIPVNVNLTICSNRWSKGITLLGRSFTKEDLKRLLNLDSIEIVQRFNHEITIK